MRTLWPENHKRQFQSPLRSWDSNIKMDLTKVWREDVDNIQLTYDGVKNLTTVLNVCVT
jgi:hypothetical protein